METITKDQGEKMDLIYIVEDESDILELLQMEIGAAGYRTLGFERAQVMLEALQSEAPRLIVLDLMLPDIDGLEVCKRLKANAQYKTIPIMMLTARSDLEDKVKGLEYGADDYITKPFEARELIARIKAVIRRRDWEKESKVLQITPGFVIDFNRYEVHVNNIKTDITLTEFKILQLLTKRPGWVYSRSQILDYLWGTDKVVIERTVDVHIRNLREKLGEYADMIKNIRGVGYQFSTQDGD